MRRLCAARRVTPFVLLISAFALSACVGGSADGTASYKVPNRDDFDGGYQKPKGKITGPGGFLYNFGGNSDSGTGAKIGVNALLWRASLDTVSFMPLASADPFGGVIITDWYTDPATPNERFKASVYILDTRLRADAVRVSLFRQVNSGGSWRDAPVSDASVRQLEDQILTRARQLRIAGAEG